MLAECMFISVCLMKALYVFTPDLGRAPCPFTCNLGVLMGTGSIEVTLFIPSFSRSDHALGSVWRKGNSHSNEFREARQVHLKMCRAVNTSGFYRTRGPEVSCQAAVTESPAGALQPCSFASRSFSFTLIITLISLALASPCRLIRQNVLHSVPVSSGFPLCASGGTVFRCFRRNKRCAKVDT